MRISDWSSDVCSSDLTPVEPQLLAQLLEMSVARISELCSELAAEYEATGRGFVLAQVAGGWRFQSHPEQAAYVERFVLEGQSARLDRTSVVSGKSVSVRVDLGGRRIINKKKNYKNIRQMNI